MSISSHFGRNWLNQTTKVCLEGSHTKREGNRHRREGSIRAAIEQRSIAARMVNKHDDAPLETLNQVRKTNTAIK
jgi:hypothetical protein